MCNRPKTFVSFGCVIDLEAVRVQDGQCDLPARFSLK